MNKKDQRPMIERYPIGTQFNIQMQKPEKGSYPIGRTESGVICLIARGTKGFFEYNSTWTVKVVEAREKSLIVVPTECVITAAAEAYALKKKLDKLQADKPKREKAKVNYQYMRKEEQQRAA